MLSVVRTLAWAFGFLTAVLASQLPEFAQQYRQRLGGAIDELQTMLVEFDADSQQLGLSRQGGIDRLRNDHDFFIRQRGVRIAESEARLQRMQQQLQDFSSAGSFGRLRVFASEYDRGMVTRTFDAFEPAVPTTSEGLVTALIGFLVGFGAVRSTTLVRRRRRVQISQRR